MVARPQCADLRPPALLGPLAHLARVGAFQAAGFLRAAQVRLGSVARLERPAAALPADLVQLGLRQVDVPLGAHPARAVVVQRRRQRIQPIFDIFIADGRAQQPHAAVDIVADAARRDHPIREARRRHAADREAVALVHVWHHQHVPHQPRQRGGIHRLLQRFVVHHRFDQLARGENAHRHPHILPERLGDLPFVIADAHQVMQIDHLTPHLLPHTSKTMRRLQAGRCLAHRQVVVGHRFDLFAIAERGAAQHSSTALSLEGHIKVVKCQPLGTGQVEQLLQKAHQPGLVIRAGELKVALSASTLLKAQRPSASTCRAPPGPATGQVRSPDLQLPICGMFLFAKTSGLTCHVSLLWVSPCPLSIIIS